MCTFSSEEEQSRISTVFLLFFFISATMKRYFIGASFIIITFVYFLYTQTRDTVEPSAGMNKNAGTRMMEFAFGDFLFDIPVTMVKSVGAGGVTWSLPSPGPDSSVITFTLPESSTADSVQLLKASLAPSDTIVREGEMDIHGESWEYVEVTTNLGQNNVYWFSDREPAVQVQYTDGNAEQVEVMKEIISSARVAE